MGHFWWGKVSQGLLEWKGRQSQLLSWCLTSDMAIWLPSCNGLSASASFVKTEVFTSPYKKIWQTQNHDFFPWTKKKKKSEFTSKIPPQNLRGQELPTSGVPWQEQTRLRKPGGRPHTCIGFAHKTPKFSGTVGRKQAFLNSLGGKWSFSITYTQNSPCDKGLPYWAD